MHVIAFALALLGADPTQGSMEECAALLAAAAAAPVCSGQSGMFDQDIAVFLAGGDSFMGRWLKKLDDEGHLTEVLNHAQRARAYWRKGMPTPKAPGH